jgi:hypothetical protein
MSKLVAVILLSMLAALPAAQTHTKPAHLRSVSLDTVLSCSDDLLLQEVLKTDVFTARLKLNALGMMMSKKKSQDDPSVQALLAKGFFTDTVDDSLVSIIPTDRIGNIIEESKLTFCQGHPLADYEYHSDESWLDKQNKPRSVEIDGQDWYFNPNEVFAHADQFHFESGIFSNSARVYFSATKGSVTIQFVCKPDGLKFYRVFYKPKD